MYETVGMLSNCMWTCLFWTKVCGQFR